METTLNLETFNPKVAELTLMKDQYVGLKITDINDKAQVKAVHDAKMTFVRTRTDIRKQWKLLREDAVKFQKMVIEKEDELIGIIEPTEKELEAEEDRAVRELARIKKEKEDEAQRVLQDRINRLVAVQYQFIEWITVARITQLNDEEFEAILWAQQKKFDDANKAKIEAEKVAEQEREAEKLRLAEVAKQEQAEREKLERDKAELAEQRRVLELEKQKIADEQKKKDDLARAEALAKQQEEIRKVEETKLIAREEQSKKDAEVKRIADEKALQERALKQEKLKKFLIANGYTNETKDQFELRWSDDKKQVALWKCIGSSFI